MQKLLNIAKVIDAINEWIGRFAYWIILLMIFIGVWNVVGRYVGRFLGYTLTSNALIEIQWYLFDIVFFLGAAYTLKHNGHVRVDVFYKDLSLKQKALVDFIGTFIFLIPFCLVIIYYSWDNVINSWNFLETSPDPGGLARYPIKSMIIVSSISLIFQGISEAIKSLNKFKKQLNSQEDNHDPSI